MAKKRAMSDEFEAVGAAVEGGLIAKAVDDEGKLVRAEGEVSGNCLNCRTPVLGKFCSNCGQPLHVHRSIGALWHDILHGVLHFEGKFWRTLPLLAWKPGDLTRRYIHGERARFISPMALFLFSVFMMFAVFSFMGSPFSGISEASEAKGADSFAEAIAIESGELQEKINDGEARLKGGAVTGEDADRLRNDIVEWKRGRNVMATMTLDEIPYPEVGMDESGKILGGTIEMDDEGNVVEMDGSLRSWAEKSAIGRRLVKGIESANKNPSLLIYKLQANGYKFAWLLIPISVPFVWLTMFGRRGFRFYDHAVFATYSIAFMSLLFIFCALLAALGVSAGIWALLLLLYPPFHMYRQLRHAYALPWWEAFGRLIALFTFTIISLVLFFLILLTLGVLG